MSSMFSSISRFCFEARDKHNIITEMEGTLLISKNMFPYFMIMAFEAGGLMRSLMLLSVYPLVWGLEIIGHYAAGFLVMTFVATAGLKMRQMKAVAKAVLPRFYLMDVREGVLKVWSSCGGKKYVITCMPRIMVEAFLREYLNVDFVVATELRTFGGYCLGVPAAPWLVFDTGKVEVLWAIIGTDNKIDVGLASEPKNCSFMIFCRENYIIPKGEESSPLHRKDYPKPLIFHDGRLVAKPTPLDSTAMFLWLPMGVLLATFRILLRFLPYKLRLLGAAATGLKIRAHIPPKCYSPDSLSSHTCHCQPHMHSHSLGQNPSNGTSSAATRMGTLYVCNHRTLLDPIMISLVLQRHVPAVTYSISKVSEILSPITTVRLSRDRFKDGETMRTLLSRGDLIVCPEGTTCREPYLLRFSPLFAEVANDVVMVAITTNVTMFHGTTVRGHKWLDPFFFFMNPRPLYHLQFLDRVPVAHPCHISSGPSYIVANQIQQLIAQALGYECTNLTRRDKYWMLAGVDKSSPTS